MTDRSNGMMIGAFISGLRPGRFFKDLIGRPPLSIEDLFTRAHNFLTADGANMENRLWESKWGTTDTRHGQSYRDSSRKQKDRFVSRPGTRSKDQ